MTMCSVAFYIPRSCNRFLYKEWMFYCFTKKNAVISTEIPTPKSFSLFSNGLRICMANRVCCLRPFKLTKISAATTSKVFTHQVGRCARFFSNGKESYGVGRSNGPKIKRKKCFENISSHTFWDPGPKYPKGVPWDQIFWSKFFLTWCHTYVVKWYFAVYWSNFKVLY